MQWFEVDKTQKLSVIDDDSVLDPNAMRELGDSERVRASHLMIDVAPTVSQYIAVQFKKTEVLPVVAEPVKTEPKIWILLAAIVVVVALIAFAA